MKALLNKIIRGLIKLRLQPIRVFCFHQVSENFDPNIYCKPDWISTHVFKAHIEKLQSEGYQFIALEQAYEYIKRDIFRFKKYAVLTADDGLKCQFDILSWLEDKHIPITIFLNVETLSGDKCGEPIKRYFKISTKDQENKHAVIYATSAQIIETKSTLLSYGYHGFDHRSVTDMSKEEFSLNLQKCKYGVDEIVTTVPFYAYTYGKYNQMTNRILKENNITPVYMDGKRNYNNPSCIHRELIENV